MAVMKFREPNRARWVGTRPGHDGTQVAKGTSAASGAVIVHTVTAGKVFHLVAAAVGYRTSGTGVTSGMVVRNAADVTQYWIFSWPCNNVGSANNSVSFPFPLEIPALFDICTYGTGAADEIGAFIFGWEDDV